MQQEERLPQPPAYAQHDPNSLNLPSVPTHTLPSLRSLDLPDAQASRAAAELSPRSQSPQWGTLPPLTSATFPRVPEGDIGSPMDMDRMSVMSGDERLRETSVLSMEDAAAMRSAAETLTGKHTLCLLRVGPRYCNRFRWGHCSSTGSCVAGGLPKACLCSCVLC